MTQEEIDKYSEIAEKADFTECQKIIDHLDSLGIPFDFDGMMIKDETLKLWFPIVIASENPNHKMIKDAQPSDYRLFVFEFAHKEFLFHIYFDDKSKEWVITEKHAKLTTRFETAEQVISVIE